MSKFVCTFCHEGEMPIVDGKKDVGQCEFCKHFFHKCDECGKIGDFENENSDSCSVCARFSCADCGLYEYDEEDDNVYCRNCYNQNQDCRTKTKCPKANCSNQLRLCQFKPTKYNENCLNHEDKISVSLCYTCEKYCCDECGTFPGGPKNDTSDWECYDCLTERRSLNCGVCDERVSKWKVCRTLECDTTVCAKCWVHQQHCFLCLGKNLIT
jgi:hypothetical protein